MESDLFARAAPHTVGYRMITPSGLRAAPHGVRLIDVREAGEFNAELGHVPGAELVPLGTLEATAMGWDRDAALVVVCRSGARSGRAAAALVRLGFRRVVNLEGGMVAYNAAGLPVARAGR